MNKLKENGHLKEMVCGTNFSYILNDNSIFMPTEYKVLQSQNKSGFLKCMKTLYNGKIQLYYITNGLKPLSYMLRNLDADSFMIIAANLLADIIEIKNIGFISCQNIDISLDHIYVEPNTYKVYLLYLPLGKKLYWDYSAFENELRTGLVKLISGISTLSSPKTMQFSSDLSNGMLTLEDIHTRMKSGKGIGVNVNPVNQGMKLHPMGGMVPPSSPLPIPEEPFFNDNTVDWKGEVKKPVTVKIIALNAPARVELLISKDEFRIGKKSSSVDGLITFNNMVSRVHCKINKNGNQVTITDLQSANGTFVNKVKIAPNYPHPIKNGDIIRLANSDFRVSIS